MVDLLSIEHVTLNTGHVSQAYRRDVSDEAINACARLIGGMLGGETLAIPGMRGEREIARKRREGSFTGYRSKPGRRSRR